MSLAMVHITAPTTPVFRPRRAVAVLAGALVLLAVLMLERAQTGLTVEELTIGTTPATLYRPAGVIEPPVAVVAHGFAGSRQMMAPTARSLAQAGVAALSFDFPGHGRNPVPMSPDVTSIDGTTEQLIAETQAVIAAVAGRDDLGPVTALVGHSMATDVMVRAAERLPEIDTVVAISMYSDAVTETEPRRLLVISGAWEARLREVALRAAQLVDPDAREGMTVRAGDVERRAVAAPRVEHVGVLYSAATLVETQAWITGDTARIDRSGPWIALLLASLVLLAWPLAALVPASAAPTEPVSRPRFLAAATLPPVLAGTAAVLAGAPMLGLSGVGPLTLFLAVWGGVQLAFLPHGTLALRNLRLEPVVLLLATALAFALALDRYGAAFLPSGARLPVMLLLLVGTLPVMLADAALSHGAPLWRRLLLRTVPLVALTAAMFTRPAEFGLMFTVLPVLLLFYLVYGTMGRFVANRAGPESTGLALGIVLAWSLAASAPLFAAP